MLRHSQDLLDIFMFEIYVILTAVNPSRGTEWLNELGSWIT